MQRLYEDNDGSSQAICKDHCQQQNITHAEIHSIYIYMLPQTSEEFVIVQKIKNINHQPN